MEKVFKIQQMLNKAEARIVWKTRFVKVRGVKVASFFDDIAIAFVSGDEIDVKMSLLIHENMGGCAVKVSAARWSTNPYQYTESCPGTHFILLEVGLGDFIQFQGMFL